MITVEKSQKLLLLIRKYKEDESLSYSSPIGQELKAYLPTVINLELLEELLSYEIHELMF